MRHTLRILIAFGSALACLVGGVAVAQDKPADNMDVLREQLRADKKAVVASVLDLTDARPRASGRSTTPIRAIWSPTTIVC